ncbi:hypothetical protein LSTR_LSTR011468 [Laodelphax striatellus]|uniref:FAS1 domain-containing protein n=1 Tax=Laodelphax striatellus TaxID=195883 RepID=A0A482WHS3_LAOST|nr:hypothetical protein LSTR_LSTR011468 [Laodelphax striatellus]
MSRISREALFGFAAIILLQSLASHAYTLDEDLKAKAEEVMSSVEEKMAQFEKETRDYMMAGTSEIKRVLFGGAEDSEVGASEPANATASAKDDSPKTTVMPNTTSANVETALAVKEGENLEGTDDEDEEDDEIVEEDFPFIGPGMFANLFGAQLPSMFNMMQASRPWWQGKNVCVSRQEKNETKDESEIGSGPEQVIMMGVSQFTSCKQTPSKYVCTTVVSQPGLSKTSTVTYQCCQGFRKTSKSQACAKVEEKPVADVLSEMGAKMFESLVRSTGLDEKLDAQNMTLFVPTDDAIKKYRENLGSDNRVDALKKGSNDPMLANDDPSFTNEIPRTQRQLDGRSSELNNKDMVLAQTTPGLIELADFTNEKMLLSEHNSTLRLNVYPGRKGPVVTVNCALITSADNYATNSIMHMVDRVNPNVNSNLVQLLDRPEFSEFKKLLESNGLLERLSEEGPFTVFAPTNEAIFKLDSGLRAKYGRGEACIQTVLKHHILGHTLCASAANNGSRISTVNLANDWLHIHMDESGNVVLDDKARIVASDMVATNGVLHALDKILSPKNAKPVSDLLASSNHSTWLELMERAGVIEELNNAENLTMFTPSEAALNKSKDVLDAMDEAALRDVIMYHAAKRPCGSKADEVLESFLPSAKLRVNTYSNLPLFSRLGSSITVECARIVKKEGKACNSAVYEIDEVLIPPNGTVLQVIQSDPQLTILKEMIEGTDLENQLKSLSEKNYTFLAPTNAAFEKLAERTRKMLLEVKDFADQVLKRHVIQDVMCCSGVVPVPWPFTKTVETISGKVLEVNRDRSDRVTFSGNRVTTCDRLATDGIVHHVSNVFMSRDALPPELGGEDHSSKTSSVIFSHDGQEIRLYGV